MRTFKLIRNEDVSGVAGTGVVAKGMVNALGQVVLRFIVPAKLADGSMRMIQSRAHYESIEDCILVHGHSGKTLIQMDETGVMFSDLDVLAYRKVA